MALSLWGFLTADCSASWAGSVIPSACSALLVPRTLGEELAACTPPRATPAHSPATHPHTLTHSLPHPPDAKQPWYDGLTHHSLTPMRPLGAAASCGAVGRFLCEARRRFHGPKNALSSETGIVAGTRPCWDISASIFLLRHAWAQEPQGQPLGPLIAYAAIRLARPLSRPGSPSSEPRTKGVGAGGILPRGSTNSNPSQSVAAAQACPGKTSTAAATAICLRQTSSASDVFHRTLLDTAPHTASPLSPLSPCRSAAQGSAEGSPRDPACVDS